MDILIGVAGIVVGGLVSWVISYYYYKKQTKEQINPIPHIQEVHRALIELYGISIDRNDEELQKALKKLVLAMLVTRFRVISRISSPFGHLFLMSGIYKQGNLEEFNKYAQSLVGRFEEWINDFRLISTEFDGLLNVAKEIVGKPLPEMITLDEIEEDLHKNEKVIKSGAMDKS